MSKTLAMMFSTLLVVGTFLPSLAIDISYPVIDDPNVPGPPTPENPYNRGCEIAERCRNDPPSRVANDNVIGDADDQNSLNDQDLLHAEHGAPAEAPL
ncbi:hypothetical protein AAHA92_28190 [Salvia divinorum]|uniref:Rapid ALkalinization Factor n=1 Tax=Salvia divinorum TaxID=28513 RepID=A0ABD1FUR2_SALDI